MDTNKQLNVSDRKHDNNETRVSESINNSDSDDNFLNKITSFNSIDQFNHKICSRCHLVDDECKGHPPIINNADNEIKLAN
jgi:hypothetical protein